MSHFCINCGKGISVEQKFCASCGQPNEIQSADSNSNVEVDTSDLKSIMRTFHGKAGKQEYIVEEVKSFLITEGFGTQVIFEVDTMIVQGRQQNKNPLMSMAKKGLGLESAITVAFSKNEDDLILRVGAAKWLDKGIGLAIAWFVLWPTALTTAWGVYRQKKLFKDIDELCIRNLS